MLNAVNVSKAYKDRVLFSDLTINITAKNRVALIGPNGSGKTTLLNILAGNATPDSGSMIRRRNLKVGYLGQEFQYKEKETVFEFIFSNISGEERELHEYKVDIIAESLELDVKKTMGMLSGGQLRRAGIARALVELEPELKSTLKKEKLTTRDSRTVERKKYGHRKARRSFQFSKR